MHSDSCFLTLTYADETLPPNGSLCPEDHKHFIKRLRKRLGARRVRYFHCGEYGETNHRPHFHTILFGYSYPNRVAEPPGPSGLPLFRSPDLESDWSRGGQNLGRAVVSDLSFEAAMYVASYSTKKLNVSKASSRSDYERWANRYQRVDPDTGELVELLPEYSTASNRPGLGASWFDRFYSDIFPHDRVILDGQKMPVPRYYDKLLERRDPELFEELKRARQRERDRSDDSPERLLSMEKCAKARLLQFGGRSV